MNNSKTPLTLAELKSQLKPLRNVNLEHKASLTKLERLAMWITEHVGTMGFFLTIFTWTFGWLLWNSFMPKDLRFDPFPAFVLWLFISNMIQIMLMPLIMVGQNLQGRHAETRAQSDFEVNTKAEHEIETVLMHLEYQNELIMQILMRLETKQNGKITK
jgi:uncharacterized membrane protein